MKILRTIVSTTAVATAIAAAPAAAQDVTIVQPGAPGQASQVLTAEQAIDLADSSYSPADVRFSTTSKRSRWLHWSRTGPIRKML